MIRGQKKPLEDKQTVNVDINTSIHNRFDIEVIDSRTGKIRQRAQAQNIILDQLWDMLLTPAAYFSFIHYGSGTATPKGSDTSLTEYIGYLQSFLSTETGENLNERYFWCRRKTQLPETEAIGKKISEIGIAYSNTEQSLCTKALIKDMNGNAISIDKSDTDVINIYATIFVHYPDNIEISNDIYGKKFFSDYLTGFSCGTSDTSYPAIYVRYHNFQVAFYNQQTNAYIKSSDFNNHVANTVFNKNDKTIELSTYRLGVNEGNFKGGIDSVKIGTTHSTYQVNSNRSYESDIFSLPTGNNTWYPGSTVTGEAIGTGDGTTVDFSSKFKLHKDCKIMVNGSSANNVTLDIDKDITADSYNIHFAEPPAEGDVITADYFTDVIAKDENHVFDLTVTIHLGEKVS